jgi:hypothetical protein
MVGLVRGSGTILNIRVGRVNTLVSFLTLEEMVSVFLCYGVSYNVDSLYLIMLRHLPSILYFSYILT